MYKRLIEICNIEKGKQIDTQLLNDKLQYKYINGGIKESGYYSEYNTQGKTVIVSEGGASCGFVNYIDEPFWCGCHCYRLTNSKINEKYLYYALKGNQNKIMDLRTGAAMPNIKKSAFSNLILNIINDNSAQEKIVQDLDCVNNLINNKQNQLIFLDELIKSRFIEMFTNKDYPKTQIRNVVDIKKISAKKTYEKNDEIRYIDISSIDNSTNQIVGYTPYIFKDAPSRAQQCLKTGDILVSTVRPNLKNIAIFNGDSIGYVGSSGFCVLRSSKCSTQYLKHIVLDDEFTEAMVKLTTGANYPAIRDDDVLDYEMIDAPMELQNEFAAFVELIDKSKFIVQQQIKDLQELLDKKMDEYFGE